MPQPNQIEHLKTMIEATQRHLNALQIQAATFGEHTPAQITTEIEDYEAKLTDLLTKYKTLAPGAASTPAQSRANWYLAHPYLGATEHFTGRQAEQHLLTGWLAKAPAHPLLLLRALGGFGKSALTWHWLHSAVDPTVWPRVVWWSLYETDATFENFLSQTLAYLGHDPTALTPSQQVQTLLRQLHQPGLLLVLDGFERALRAYSGLGAVYQGDADAPQAGATHGSGRACVSPLAEEFLRGVAARPSLPGRVLMTSRLRPTPLEARGGLLLQGCREEELTALPPADAVAYLRAHDIQGHRTELEAAGRPYGYHPLSLQLLVGYLLADFDRPGDIAAAEALDLSGDLIQRRHHVLEQSYQRLSLPQRHLLGTIACFRGTVEITVLRQVAKGDDEEAPPQGETEGGQTTNTDSTLKLLIERGLLHHDPTTRRFDLHPIVRRYAYDRLTDPSAAHTRLRDYFAAIDPPATFTRLAELTPLIEQYHHTLRAGQYDAARELFYDRINQATYYQFGAYQLRIDLLRGLFPAGEDQPPRLSSEAAQAWTLDSLAASYSLNGQPGRVIPLFEMGNALDEKRDDKQNLAVGLGNLAYMAQLPIGALQAAEANLCRQIALCREIEDEFREAIGHRELGRLLAYRGVWPEAAEALATAQALFEEQDNVQSQGLVWAYRALAGLLWERERPVPRPQPSPGGRGSQVDSTVRYEGNEGQVALDAPFPPPLAAAGRALELAEERKKIGRPNARDFIWAYWLLGAALCEEGDLTAAENHLTEALTRCRAINTVDTEAEILLDLARLRAAQGATAEAQRLAEEALLITERSGYVLQGADIKLFLAQQALAAGEPRLARQFAQQAQELALCADGPPHHYKVAYDQAEALLASL